MLLLGLLPVVLAGEPAVAAPGFPQPEPSILHDVIRHHDRSRWLRVTTAEDRFELRASTVDAAGLHGLRLRHAGAVPDDPMPWARIARIDYETDGRTRGAVTGAIYVGLAAMLIPASEGDVNSHGPRDFFFAGAAVGAVVGHWMGRQKVREHPVYVAPLPEPVAPAVRDTARASVAAPADTPGEGRIAGGVPAVPAPGTPEMTRGLAEHPGAGLPPDPARVRRALARLRSGNLLRIRAGSSLFQCYAGSVDERGFSSLRRDMRHESMAPPPSLAWTEIERVESLGGAAGAGAARGAMYLGASGALLGWMVAEAASQWGSGEISAGQKLAASLAVGGVGAGLGALIGATVGGAVPRWRVVYSRR